MADRARPRMASARAAGCLPAPRRGNHGECVRRSYWLVSLWPIPSSIASIDGGAAVLSHQPILHLARILLALGGSALKLGAVLVGLLAQFRNPCGAFDGIHVGHQLTPVIHASALGVLKVQVIGHRSLSATESF